MTPILLVDKLVEFIETVVTEYNLATNVNGIYKKPQVVAGYLNEKKPRQQQEPPDYPFIIVRYIKDEDTGEQNTATVKVYIGTYSEDIQNGWRDCMNVATHIKQALLKEKFIGKAFIIDYPVKTEMPEEQSYPEWFAILTLNVVIPQTQEEGGYIKDVFV
ncbi:MAG: hypothetical protein H0Z40_01475 [Desulfotomaculum sp.]|nr:hypothetical protein [Desulfotomaculum sp.]